jgi:hypothetical protein
MTGLTGGPTSYLGPVRHVLSPRLLVHGVLRPARSEVGCALGGSEEPIQALPQLF